MIKRGGYLEKLFVRLRRGTEQLDYGREVIARWAGEYANGFDSATIAVLDIGLATGTDLLNIKGNLVNRNVRLFGIECYEPNIEEAKQNGITVYPINIEAEAVPAADGEFDIIVANQIMEHTKEIFWIFGEISRVLKKGGIAIIGIPNLASLHNRIILLFGEQPTSIEMLAPHVRGITKPSFIRFITADGYFRVVEVKGSNFFGFRPRVSSVLSKLFPTFSTVLFFLIQRTNKEGNFGAVLESRFFETPYFGGGG